VKDQIFNFCPVYLEPMEGVLVFNATFNNISVISWRSVLLVVETVAPGEKGYLEYKYWFIWRVKTKWVGKKMYIPLYFLYSMPPTSSDTFKYLHTNCRGICVAHILEEFETFRNLLVIFQQSVQYFLAHLIQSVMGTSALFIGTAAM
jgi:hypothetical protein